MEVNASTLCLKAINVANLVPQNYKVLFNHLKYDHKVFFNHSKYDHKVFLITQNIMQFPGVHQDE